MKVSVIYESRTGNTAKAAGLIAQRIAERGHAVALSATDSIDLKALAEADVVVVGTWTDGAILFGQRPGSGGALARNLPDLWDKPTFSFVTYAVRAGNVLKPFRTLLESKGAKVLGGLELHRRHLDTDAPDFGDAVVDAAIADGLDGDPSRPRHRTLPPRPRPRPTPDIATPVASGRRDPHRHRTRGT
ncbi:MAG: flavodoxin family protein [Microthrixaceae bacterium]